MSGAPTLGRVSSTSESASLPAAGAPDTIWNMDARALAVSDPYVKSPQPTDGMDRGTHTQLATSRRY
jgi:hypothetical protein